MDYVKGGKGQEERAKKILEEWEKEVENEDNIRRDRQHREDDIGEPVEKETEFRHKYPPNCS